MSYRDDCIMCEEFAHFLDPISLDIMNDPVIASDGKTYERHSIATWIETRRKIKLPLTSPLTNLPLANDSLIPNIDLKDEILRFLAERNSTIKIEDIKFSLSSELYTYLDQITHCDLYKELNLKPPQIIVLGNESHGKSSLLERIVGLPLFPREKHICTRCVVRVQLRRSKVANPLAEIAVVIKQQSGSYKTLNFSNYSYNIQKVPMDNIRITVKETMDRLLQEQPTKQLIDDREIVIKIELPFVLNLDLVDLPGLITTSPVGCQQDLPKVSRDIAMNIIEKEKDISFFILINDVRVPPNQSRGCEIIHSAGVGYKTLGCFTKIDAYTSEDSDDSTDLQALLEANLPSSFPVGYGWMGTSSKSIVVPVETSASLLELQKLYKIDEQERKMIETKYPLLEKTKNTLGIKKIRQQIQSLYDHFVIENWIPNIFFFLNRSIDDHVKHLTEMGLPLGQIPEYQEYYLPNISKQVDCRFPTLKIIDTIQFKQIIKNKIMIIFQKNQELITNNKEMKLFYHLKVSILERFVKKKDIDTHQSFNNLFYVSPTEHISEKFETSSLKPIDNFEDFIENKIELFSNDFKLLFVYLTNAIDTSTQSILSNLLIDIDKDSTKLSRFSLAINTIQEEIIKYSTQAKETFKQWFDQALQQLFMINHENSFSIIKFRYASPSVFGSLLMDDEVKWAWTNPIKYHDFLDLMLFQYYKNMRSIFMKNHLFDEINLPETIFQTDSDISIRIAHLKSISVNIEVINELKRLRNPFHMKELELQDL